MADGSKAQKLKLANSRKRFKELQELKKKKNATQKPETDNSENICSEPHTEPTPVDSLTSSTHSSINNDLSNEQVRENIPEGYKQLPNYFNNIPYQDNYQQPAVFFDSFLQKNYNESSDKDFSGENNSSNMFNFFSTSPTQINLEHMVSNIVGSPTSTETNKFVPAQHDNARENYSLFPQVTQNNYVAETQHIIHPNEDARNDDPETKQNEDFNSHSSSDNIFSAKNTKDLIDYLEGSKEDISETENLAIKDEITDFSNQTQAEIQHSSAESLRQLSDQMAQLMEPEYCSSSSITDLEKRNLELAALLDQEKVKSEKQNFLINDLQIKVAQLEKDIKEKDEYFNLHTADQVRKLNEELKCHNQTIGMLVAEKAELSASLSQFEFCSKQKTQECEELQTRLKASRSRVADLEREVNELKSAEEHKEHVIKNNNLLINKLQQEYDAVKVQKDELVEDTLEAWEKVKQNNEENMSLRQENKELSSKLSLANIKIQQITDGEQYQAEGQLEKSTQEKFDLEKQLLDLNHVLKTVTKERDESALHYQQYAQQQNAQLASLSNKIEQLQVENEKLSAQEQSRIRHISELERQLQNLQNEQVTFAISRNGSDSTLKNDLETTRELCVQLQIEKTATEENYVKVVNEKEMLLKELEAKSDSLMQLESLVEQLRGNQPDSVKLLATMESDKVAAARAVQQNKELKQQMDSMQEVFIKLNNDKVELTEKLNREVGSNKELLEKLQKTEIHLHTLTDAIEIKDRELSHLRDNSTELNKQVLQHEQLADRLRHYEAQDNVSHVVQNELQEAQKTIARLNNEVELLRISMNENGNTGNVENADVIGSLTRQLEELRARNSELESKLRSYLKDNSDQNCIEKDTNSNETNNLDKEIAMKYLEDKFKRTMQDIADLTEEKQRLEHLVLQLQGETETIGEYVALYQHQRMVLKQKAVEKDQQLKQLANDREQMKNKLEKLNELIKTLVVEKGTVPTELLEEHQNVASQSKDLCEEHYKIHEEISKISDNKLVEQNDAKSSETAEQIIALLSEIKSSNLVQPNESIHHCAWCSGQLITV